jgi:hypothetical protein
MSALSNYLEKALLQEIFNATNYAAPDTWVALYTGAPTDAGGGTEVSGGAYARIRVYKAGGTSPAWNASTVDGVGYVVDNANSITFAAATAAWGTVTNFGVHDHASTGNLLYHGALGASKNVGNGDTFKFVNSNLNLRME